MPVSSHLQDISKSRFTEATLAEMYRLVDRAKTDPAFQKLVYTLVNRAMPGQYKDYRREIETVFEWARRRIAYRRDPYAVEVLQDVWRTLDVKRGDCDDLSILLASMSEVLGAPSRFVTVSTRPDKDPQHVYVQVLVGGRWEGLDATVSHSFMGWEPVDITDKRIWTRESVGLSGEDEPVMEGLMGLNGSLGHHRQEFYDSGFFQPQLPPGIHSNVAQTWAHPNPGELMITERVTPSKDVVDDSERPEMPGPADVQYGRRLPIIAHPLPGDTWKLIEKDEVPMVLDPDTWTGSVPFNVQDETAMLPQPNVPEDRYMSDLAGLGAEAAKVDPVAVSWLESTVKSLLGTGQASGFTSAYDQAMELYKKKRALDALRKEEERKRREAAAAAAGVPYREAAVAEGMPGWVLPIGIGAAVLFLAGGLLKK